MNHFDAEGRPHLVDVSHKPVTVRVAVATSRVTMSPATAATIRGGDAKKGDVLGVARLAAINATKQTPQLIPLCHAIAVESVTVAFSWDETSRETVLWCRVEVRTSAKTGVEMEALTAAAAAGLTVYDMVKSIDRGMTIGPIRLESKSGGASGDYRR